jgi:hypothetical protein
MLRDTSRSISSQQTADHFRRLRAVTNRYSLRAYLLPSTPATPKEKPAVTRYIISLLHSSFAPLIGRQIHQWNIEYV